MAKDTHLVHFTIIDGNKKDLKSLGEELAKIKKKLTFDMEFLVTNDRIELHDVKFLINELYVLYKKAKKLKEIKK